MKKVQAIDAVYAMRDMSMRDKAVLVRLIQRMRKETGFICWPSEQSIADDCGCSRNTARAALKALMERGLLVPSGKRKSPGGGRPIQEVMLNIEVLKALINVQPLNIVEEQCAATEHRNVQTVTPECAATAHELLRETTNENHKENLPSREVAVLDLPVPAKAKPAVRGRCEYSHEFEEFWDLAYRREGKGAAAAAYDRALKRIDRDTLLAAWSLVNSHWFATKKERRFVPHPSTWLSQGRWDDAPPDLLEGSSGSTKINKFTAMRMQEEQEAGGWLANQIIQGEVVG